VRKAVSTHNLNTECEGAYACKLPQITCFIKFHSSIEI